MLPIFSHILFVLALSPLLLGVIGKTKAFFAGRWGPPLLQPWYDIAKLFRKGVVYSTTTSWVFKLTPVVVMATALASCIFVPWGSIAPPVYFWGDALLFIYLYGLMRFFLIIGALDTGSSFEGMGASREAAFSCLSEIVLFMDFILLVMVSKSLVLCNMLNTGFFSSWLSMGPVLVLVAVSFFLVMLVENSRIPIDDPNTHLELTMIHEVMVLDHSGYDLGLILWGSYIKLFVLGSVLVSLFVPAHLSPLTGVTFFLCGMGVLGITIGVVESVMARLRLNRVPHLLIGAFVLATLGFIVILLKGA
ncbi:MAG: NADH-quinone oxidoreductase subunit H [Candidatus Omnitrophica bacterium]|nr:NADH-quinone oxidoreductase subunit H [Candidatus Omnitrophota bacterium]MDE2008611.1 NADH-quinone oxidoreductase subunit H [Candidatus Omnitrophota bacterium]MDE2214077.1 NADH-quinone oxidoreductase subunit H [Candidatus Omnitrophota bacterium]MDE2230945.1 NADH-quinone oxidoreductase subunit H [Candidatus Omnitrophota bacterium]